VSPEKRKPVMGVVGCLNCNRLLPGGLWPCPHCRSSNQQMAIPKDLLEWMYEAREKADEGARSFATGDLRRAIQLTREAIAMNPWNAKAHGNLGHALMKSDQLEEAAESLERAALLCPTLEGVSQAITLVGQMLGRPQRSWRRYRFLAIFQFDTDKHAVDSLQVLPDELLDRMERPKLTRAPNGAFLQLGGDPLTKAEIWYILLAIDACGFKELTVGLPGMTKDEQYRVFGQFMEGRLHS
jgi:tetratricopeptide (TPR) repeat protein